jgi:hypothetical protein
VILSFLENMREKTLGFGRMHENKIFFLFLKWKFIFEISEKNKIFFISNLYLIV